jgi:disulfide bond formation protein DsbB
MDQSLSSAPAAQARLAVPSPFGWSVIAILASVATLGAAHSFETFGGYAPCELCLHQREVYWVALAVGLLGLAATRRWPQHGRKVALLLAAIFAVGMVLAAYHAGVEWKWWPGPTSCTGGTGSVSASAMTDLLNGKKARPPACDQAAWRMFGISMAGYNALISAALVALGALVAVRRREAKA